MVQYRPWDHTGAQAGPRPSKAPPLWPSLSLSLSPAPVVGCAGGGRGWKSALGPAGAPRTSWSGAWASG